MMLLTRLLAYLEARSAVVVMSISEFIEAKLKQLTRRIRPQNYELVVQEDGTTQIRELNTEADQERLDYSIRDQDIQRKHTEIEGEIASLDRRIREEEDKLAEIKDGTEIARRNNPAPEPILREIRSSLFCLFFFLAVEVITMTLFFKDVFPENPILLLLVAIGTTAATLLLGLKIYTSIEQKKTFWAILWITVLILWGVGLGYFRALAVTSGEVKRFSLTTDLCPYVT